MYIDKSGNKWYKVGLHVHTSISDGALSPEDAAQRYADAGFDAIAITDHWKFYPEGELNGLKIISGCEYNVGGSDTATNVMHIVGIGMKSEPELPCGSQSSKQEVIDKIKLAGGMAVLAHPAWSLNSPDEIMALNGFDMLEIYNSVSNVGQSSRPYSGYITDLLANKGVVFPLTATDDAHYYQGEDDTLSYIMVNCNSCNSEDIMNAIESRSFYATQGPELYVKREGNRIIADCSECIMIDFLSNAAWAPDKIIRGEKLTHAEYEIKPFEKWVRVEVHDQNGKYAWSNIIEL